MSSLAVWFVLLRLDYLKSPNIAQIAHNRKSVFCHNLVDIQLSLIRLDTDRISIQKRAIKKVFDTNTTLQLNCESCSQTFFEYHFAGNS